MQDIIIRLAEPDEADAVHQLVVAAYNKWILVIHRPPRPMTADYAALIAQHYVNVLLIKGALAGVLVIWPMEDALYIDNIAVHPDFQRQGIGERLLDFAEQQAHQAGLTMMRLLTHEKMIVNQQYYLKHGYEVTRYEPIGDGGQVVWMHKPISHDNKEQV